MKPRRLRVSMAASYVSTFDLRHPSLGFAELWLRACPRNDNPTTEDTEDRRKNPVYLQDLPSASSVVVCLATTINAELAEPAEKPVLFCEFCGFCVECRASVSRTRS
jgi:hypothetical protein